MQVRELYGFPVQATVACGDSGNDILMLQVRGLCCMVDAGMQRHEIGAGLL